jgi:hypothetical protein
MEGHVLYENINKEEVERAYTAITDSLVEASVSRSAALAGIGVVLKVIYTGTTEESSKFVEDLSSYCMMYFEGGDVKH